MSRLSLRRFRSFAACAVAATSAFTVAFATLASSQGQGGAPQGAAPLVVIAIFDGLRPDIVSPQHTPNIDRLKQAGVHYTNSHAAFPTVTRVNAGTLVTGTWPERHGLVSNTMYVPAVDPVKPFSTGEWKQLIKLRDTTGGRVVFTKTLGEYVQDRGLAYVAASSGSTGSALMLNTVAPEGVGVLINPLFEPGARVAFPDRVNDAIRQRVGDFKEKGGSDAVNWVGRALREYVAPEVKADVLAVWFTEPDGSQHEHGVNSPEALSVLGNSDRDFGLLLEALAKQYPGRPINVVITSDHGFARHAKAVNITRLLIAAKLKSAAASDDVVVVSNSQSVLLHVKGRDAKKIQRIVEFLQAQEEVGPIFTRGGGTPLTRPGRPALPIGGSVEGTFALELAHAANDARGADIMFAFRWSDEKNRFGVEGTQTIHSETREGALEGDASGHGGLSPYAVRNTLILAGPAFRRGAEIDVPAGIVDITPTVLELLKITPPEASFDGRVLREAFAGGEQTLSHWSDMFGVRLGPYGIDVHLSGVDGRWYLDKAARVTVTP